MKKMLINAVLAMFAVLAMESCSKLYINNDPIISGIWSIQMETINSKNTEYKEWIFNDANLGRFHHLKDDELLFQNDFRWEFSKGWYTIQYTGTNLPNNVVQIVEIDNETMLKTTAGNLVAKLE